MEELVPRRAHNPEVVGSSPTTATQGDTAPVPPRTGAVAFPRHMRTATIKGVELVSVGTWSASTGVTPVTREDLESMLAAHADGFVDKGPIKLGHDSTLNDALGDGAPAYGWVVPTGIRKNALGRDTLIGDLIGIPAKLADIAATAYRRRSVEIAWGVKAASGKTYRAVLAAVALLGADAPAVKGLDDLHALYTQGNPDEDHRTTIEVVDGLEDNAVAVAMLSAARHAGAGTAQLDAIAAAAGASDTADVPPPVEDAGNDDTQTPTQTNPQEGRTMTVTDDQIRQALGLEADADVDAEVARVIAERAAAGTDTGTAAPGTPATPVAGTPAAGAPVATPPATAPVVTPPAGTPELVGAGAPAGGAPETVTLSAGTWAEAQAAIAWAETQRRTGILDDAMRAGRIAPAERGKFTSELAAGETASGWAAAIERDEAGTTALLSGLAPRFAVTEFGDASAPNAQAADAAFDAFEVAVFGDQLGRTGS